MAGVTLAAGGGAARTGSANSTPAASALEVLSTSRLEHFSFCMGLPHELFAALAERTAAVNEGCAWQPPAFQSACMCRLRIFFSRVIASSAVTASSIATMMNTEVQLPVVCLRNAAAGPPRIEP